MAFLASPTLGTAYAALLLAGPDSTDGQKLNSMQASGGGGFGQLKFGGVCPIQTKDLAN